MQVGKRLFTRVSNGERKTHSAADEAKNAGAERKTHYGGRIYFVYFICRFMVIVLVVVALGDSVSRRSGPSGTCEWW